MSDLEAELKELLQYLRSALPPVKDSLPTVLDYETAARELSRSPRQLARMVHDGFIQRVPVGKTWGIPRAEIDRIARGFPAAPRERPVAKNRRAEKVAAKTAGAKIREMAKAIKQKT